MTLSGQTPTSLLYNVKEMGCAGDGVTDDRIILQRIIDVVVAAGGGTLYFPPGNYIVSRSGANSWCLDTTGDNLTFLGEYNSSFIKQQSGLPNSAIVLLRVNQRAHCSFTNMGFDGNWGNAVTAVADASNLAALPQATINVDDTTDFPAGPAFFSIVNTLGALQTISYTAKTATSFTGCALGTGTIVRGAAVGYQNSEAGLNQTTQATHNTTIAVASNGVVLPNATINVASTAGFLAAGKINVNTSLGFVAVNYTGVTGTSFTGCTGGYGTMATGGAVFQGVDPQNHGIMLRGAADIEIDHCVFRQNYGDAIWIGGAADPNNIVGSTDIRILNTNTNLSARNAISFAQKCQQIVIQNCQLTNYHNTCIDAESGGVFKPVRDITVESSLIGQWWYPGDPDLGTGNIAVSIVGADLVAPSEANVTRKYRLHDCTILGSIQVSAAIDVVISDCRIILDFLSTTTNAPIFVTDFCSDIWLVDNYIYDRTTGSALHEASIQVSESSTTQDSLNPSGVHVIGNRVYAKNTNTGITVHGTGITTSHVPVTGVATATSATTMTDGTAPFVASAFIGWRVRIGAAVATIQSNTTTVLTFDAWATPLGTPTATPAAGAYSIIDPSGFIRVEGNFVDCGNDGNGAGANGIHLVSSNPDGGPSTLVRDNILKNCTTSGILVDFSTAAALYKDLSIEDNVAYDDQLVPTCLQCITFTGTPHYTNLILANNLSGTGVAGTVTGLATGVWLLRANPTPAWTGFGSPEGVVSATVGSTYQRKDGVAGQIFYVKESSPTPTTGWVSYASPSSGTVPWAAQWIPNAAGTAAITAIGSGAPAAQGTATIAGYSSGGMFVNSHKVDAFSAAGAGSVCGWHYVGGANFIRGTGGGGGFHCIFRFAICDAVLVATANMFVGLSDSLANGADVAPSTLTNIVGVGCDNGDTHMQLYASGAAAQGRTDLGASFPVNTVSLDLYELILDAVPSGATITYQLTNLTSGAIATGVISVAAQLPAVSTGLAQRFIRSNGGTGSAVGISMAYFYGGAAN